MAKKVDVKKGKGESKSLAGTTGSYPLSGLRDEIDRAFDRILGSGWMMPGAGLRHLWDLGTPGGLPAAFGGLAATPKAEFSESETAYELALELPGLDQKDFEVSVSDDAIVVKGEKKDERETKEKDYHFTERSYGSFHRSFRMPPGVETGKVAASFSNGVLRLDLPKTKQARAKARKVAVTSG